MNGFSHIEEEMVGNSRMTNENARWVMWAAWMVAFVLIVYPFRSLYLAVKAAHETGAPMDLASTVLPFGAILVAALVVGLADRFGIRTRQG